MQKWPLHRFGPAFRRGEVDEIRRDTILRYEAGPLERDGARNEDWLNEIRIRSVALILPWFKVKEVPEADHPDRFHEPAGFFANLANDRLFRRLAGVGTTADQKMCDAPAAIGWPEKKNPLIVIQHDGKDRR